MILREAVADDIAATHVIRMSVRENNGIRVYEQRTEVNPKDGKDIHVMSNGLSYSKDEQGKWYVA